MLGSWAILGSHSNNLRRVLKGGAKVVAEGEEWRNNPSQLFLVVIVWRKRDIAFKMRFLCFWIVFWN